MILNINISFRLTHEKDGFLIQFIDYPEAITQADNLEDVFAQALDCLEEALANKYAIKKGKDQ